MLTHEFGQALVGRIVLVRNGRFIADYDDSRITTDDYGNGLTAALAALQPGDTLMARGIRASTAGLTCSQSNVQLLFEDVTVIPKTTTNYAALFAVSGSDCLLRGLTTDGRVGGVPQANTGEGIGIDVQGNKNRMCHA